MISIIGGSAPATLGFNAFGPEWLYCGRPSSPRPFRLPSRRSGRIPALPYPPLGCSQRGLNLASPSTFSQRMAITPLTSCLRNRRIARAVADHNCTALIEDGASQSSSPTATATAVATSSETARVSGFAVRINLGADAEA